MENLKRYYAGIFFISLATLLFETSLIRIFSVTLFSPFAFMIVSSALFGFGLGGVYLSLFPFTETKDYPWFEKRLALLAAGFSLSTLISLITILKIPFQISHVTTEPIELLILIFHYVVLILPFFFAGTVISMLLSYVSDKINTLYFFDLIGAGIGAILIVPLLPVLGGPGLVVFTSLLGLLSAIFFSVRGSRIRYALYAVIFALLIVLVKNVDRLELQAYETKREFSEDLQQKKVIFSKWNAISRIDVSDQPEKHRRKIFIDGGTYVTVMLPFDGNFEKMQSFEGKSWFLPYLLKHHPEILIIGSGGGREVLIALSYGPQSITAVELDPIIVDIVRGKFDKYIGGIFNDPRVTLIHDEGRSYIQRTQERFDIIQQVNNNSPVAMASGALNLSETYLLTVEAFHDYLDHLTEGGILAINRSGAVKLTALARRVFDERGIQDGKDRIVALQGDESSDDELFLLKNGPFTAEELAKIRSFAEQERLQILYSPELTNSRNLYDQILTAAHPDRLYNTIALNLFPPTDDQPFFNHMRKWSELGLEPNEIPQELQKLVHVKTAHLPFDGGDLVLFVLLGEAALLSALFIFLPLYLFRRRGLQVQGKGKILGYFAALGLGFILVEISLMQRFVLFLGYPIYAITTILFTILVSAGIGSFLSNRFRIDPQRHLIKIIAALGGMLIVYLFLMPHVFEMFLDDPFIVRYMISIALLAPLGVLMGMPFPLGIRILDQVSPQLIPWAWGINGYMTVVGSVLSVILAMTLGFNAVLLAAAAIYLFGLIMILRVKSAGQSCALQAEGYADVRDSSAGALSTR